MPFPYRGPQDVVFSGLWLPRGKYAHAHGSRYGQGPSDKWHQETAGNLTRRASLVTSRATVVSREPYRPGLWRWGRAHLLKKELREAEHFLSLLPIVFQKCFSAYFNLSWVQSFPKEKHWPLCGSWVYCYLYLWGSSSHRLGTISHIMSSWPHNTHTFVFYFGVHLEIFKCLFLQNT